MYVYICVVIPYGLFRSVMILGFLSLPCEQVRGTVGWLRFVDSLKLWASFAKEPYKRDDILQKRPVVLRSLQMVATPY